jgi:hypothetical protein
MIQKNEQIPNKLIITVLIFSFGVLDDNNLLVSDFIFTNQFASRSTFQQ